jgi:hypothetical protein
LLKNPFSLRKDQRGQRPVYNLGNEHGHCPHRCTFCDVGRSRKVTEADNIKLFFELHEQFLHLIEGPYHPLIYNQGNVTNPIEFSRSSLRRILHEFNKDPRIVYVSLNSRSCYITHELLELLVSDDLTFPIHFIFGLESFSDRAKVLFGKNTTGELDRIIDILRPYNQSTTGIIRGNYRFGLDVNLVFLPEMYLKEGESRVGNEQAIATGMIWELEQLLSSIDPSVPVEINLHPYYAVGGLPFESMDISFFMNELPALQALVDKHNRENTARTTHLFVGIEGGGYYQDQLLNWIAQVERFNITGVIRGS